MKEIPTSKAVGQSPDQSFSLCLTKNSVDPILGQPYPFDNLAFNSVGSHLCTALPSGLQTVLFVDTNNTVTLDFNTLTSGHVERRDCSPMRC
jgi:hypothetical protein